MTAKKSIYFTKTIKYLLILIVLVNVQYAQAQYTAIPDMCFESKLVNLGIDSDGQVNGQVLTSDINTVTVLDLPGGFETCTIQDLTGIEDFTALEEIFIDDHHINHLDFSNNPNLRVVSCSHSDVYSINVSQNTLLERLYCEDNNIAQIDISNNPNLDIINLKSNSLYSIDLSNNPNLEDVDVQLNNLHSIDISNNPQLVYFGITFNAISEVDFSNNLELELIFVGFNQISNIDVSLQTHLRSLYVPNNQISSLDVSNNAALINLLCNNNQIQALDVSNNLQLDWLWCKDNQINTLDISSNSLISKLDCSNNNLEYLNVQNGNNQLLTGVFYNFQPYIYDRFIATGNPNLSCIYVDDAPYSTANWTNIDTNSHFVETEAACNALAVDLVSLDEKIRIYPNTVKDILHIKSTKTIDQISIYSLLGKKVMAFNAINNQSINVKDLKKGIYYVRIKAGNKFLTKKIIKS